MLALQITDINIRKVYGARNRRSSKGKNALLDRQTSSRTGLRLKRADRAKKTAINAYHLATYFGTAKVRTEANAIDVAGVRDT